MEKLIYLIRDRADRDRAELRETLTGPAAAALRDAGGTDVTVHVADDRVHIGGPMPEPDGAVGVVAAVSVWFAAHDLRGDADTAVDAVGVRSAGYLVTESLWSDFGQRRGEPRDWPDGDRSPGLVTLALVHQHRADVSGNAVWLGEDPFMDDLMVRAADRAFVSTEEIVATEALTEGGVDLTHQRISRLDVTGVIESPNGAHFTECPPNYGRDEAFQKRYAATAKSDEAWDEFRTDFLDLDEAGYQAKVKELAS